MAEHLISQASEPPPERDIICGRLPKINSEPLKKYFYNPVTEKCEKLPNGSMYGTGNKFATYSDCMNYCRSAKISYYEKRDFYWEFYHGKMWSSAEERPASYEEA